MAKATARANTASSTTSSTAPATAAATAKPAKPSALVGTRVIYCGDNLDQLRKLPDACIDLIYIDPSFNSNRNYEVFWGETRAGFMTGFEFGKALLKCLARRAKQAI